MICWWWRKPMRSKPSRTSRVNLRRARRRQPRGLEPGQTHLPNRLAYRTRWKYLCALRCGLSCSWLQPAHSHSSQHGLATRSQVRSHKADRSPSRTACAPLTAAIRPAHSCNRRTARDAGFGCHHTPKDRRGAKSDCPVRAERHSLCPRRHQGANRRVLWHRNS